MNVATVCPNHAQKPGKYVGQDPASFIGEFVKLGFPAKWPTGEPSTEHMWVRVTKLLPSGELQGDLNQDPVLFYDEPLKCGDEVAFTVDEIEDVWKDGIVYPTTANRTSG